MAVKHFDPAQAAAASLVGVAAPELMEPEAIIWVMAAMGVCTLTDAVVQPGASRPMLAARYLGSVAVTLAASYAASAAVHIYWPEWRGHEWAVRIAAAIAAGLVLHPLVAAAPAIMRDVWDAVLSRVRGALIGHKGGS